MSHIIAFLTLFTLSTSLTYAGMPKAYCDNLKKNNFPAWKTMVKSKGCKGKIPKSGRQPTPKITKAQKDSWKKYNTRRDFCEALGGRPFSNGDCQLGNRRTKHLQPLYDSAKLQLLAKEHKAWKKKWGSKSLAEICKMYKVRPNQRGTECFFSTGGENNMINANIRRYVTQREKNRKLAQSNKAKELAQKYKTMTASQRADYLEKNAGFFIDTSKKGRSWKEAREICVKNGMDLPKLSQLEKSASHISGFMSASTKENMLHTYIRDELTYLGYVKPTGKVAQNRSPQRNCYVSCIKLSASEKSLLAANVKKDNETISNLTAKTPLEYWQKVAENPSTRKLELIYRLAKNRLALGDGTAHFAYEGNILTLDRRYINYNSREHEVSSNQFKWAFKPDAGQRKQFAKNMMGTSGIKSYGITNKGLKSFVSKVKSQPLFKVLSNVQTNSNKYRLTVTGNFKDTKGKNHTVYLEIGATGYHLSVDYRWNR